jgi:peptide chain release factor 2
MRERTQVASAIDSVRAIEGRLSDNIGLLELAELENDSAMVEETEKALDELQAFARRKRMESLLSGEADNNDAYLQVNAGAGGTEAQDWGEILARMYMRWAEQHNYKVSIIERSDGEEAGLKSCTMKIEGPQAYGWLKTETGVHRLVRISPFDSNARRHTSFASISVSPIIDDEINIVVEDKDLRVDTYRSSGKGGQHVNTTDSAVRLTHIPSGIAVACQAGRSQHQNKAEALRLLKAKLYEAELNRREEQAAKDHGEKTDIGWGHQIRSYVLQPYQMIKDVRTGIETSNTQAVLDGDLDFFWKPLWLRARANAKLIHRIRKI